MSHLKFSCPLKVDLELREIARREGRTLSEVILRCVLNGLESSPVEMDEEAVIDKVERGHRGNAVAVYLSRPIAAAVRQLARDEERSQSWIVRRLLRDELRRRGALPPVRESANTVADAEQHADAA